MRTRAAERRAKRKGGGRRSNRRKSSGGSRIVFSVASGVPAEAVEMLNYYGVKVRLGQVGIDKETGVQDHTISVSSGQQMYAAGLLEGHGWVVLYPTGVKPIKPSRSWGAPQRSRQPSATIVRGLYRAIWGKFKAR